MAVITIPGVYDIPNDEYHRDPVPGGSLSSTGARKLLPPSCPALFRYEQDNPPAPRQTFDFGTAAHKEVLGVGSELVVVDADDWRTKKAREQRDEAHARGAVPLKRTEYDQVLAMAGALRAHPIANALLNPARGRAEQALFWRDEPTGVWRRALVDWLAAIGTRRPIIADYKSTVRADPDSIQRTVHAYGYHCQAGWYLDGALALGYPDDTAFVFICQEKTPPYLVTVVELDGVALKVARARNRQAIEIYRDCTTTGHWPGYSDDIALIPLPAWAERRELEEIA
jgi:hypothetical protein